MDQSRYNRTYQSLTNLFINCKKSQDDDFVKKFRIQDQIAHAKEFGTVSMCGPRRSGHTTSIARLLNNFNGSWMVINPNQSLSERSCKIFTSYLISHKITKYTSSYITAKDIDIKFISIGQINQLRGVELDGIIVDCASFIKRKQKEELYLNGLPCMHFKDYVFFMFIQ